MTTTILLVRHGETDWNAARRWQGHADQPLNDRGREQARELADRLGDAGAGAIYTSDLARSRETAEILGARLGLPVLPRRALREIDVGEWSGLTWDELEQRFPEGVARWRETGRGWERGESQEDMSARVVAVLRELAAEHPGDTVLVVGHGGTIRAALAHAQGVDVAESRRLVGPLENCAVFRIAAEDGVFRAVD